MPRVLRIINRFNLGGPTYNAAYLSKYIDSSFETLLVGGMKDESEGSSEFIVRALGLNPLIIPEMRREVNFKQDVIAYKRLKNIISEFKPDIVHTHASKAGALGRLAAYNSNVPVIIHTFHGHVFHSYFGSLKTSFYRNIERYLAKKTNRIIAISEKQKEELTVDYKICEEEKISVIPLGFDLSRFTENQDEKRAHFRQKYQLSDDEIGIGIVGRLVPVKNHKLFLDSIKAVTANTSKKVRAFVIGDGELKQSLVNYASEIGLSVSTEASDKATVQFTSWIRDVDIAYAGLDIATLTSFNEGTPVSLIEAQAASKPIVSTRVGGIENIVLENKTAFLSESDNQVEFTNKLLHLIENHNKMKLHGKEGSLFVMDKYSHTRLCTAMSSLYFELLNSKLKNH